MRLSSSASMLCVVDVQERLVPAIADGEAVVARCRRLAEGREAAWRAGRGDGAVSQGAWGHSVLAGRPASAAARKDGIQLLRAEGFSRAIPNAVGQIVVCGFETHVCVAQTTLDLLAEGYAVFLAIDAVSSRHVVDRDAALRRLEGAGAVPTTSEAILFEWCRTASHPQFQSVRKLVL